VSAVVIILPVQRGDHRTNSDFNEQHTREKLALLRAERNAPPRTRPLVVIDNSKERRS
jgi:hypothetical protein